jgi:O-antigen/teichoic acid export membrane protein
MLDALLTVPLLYLQAEQRSFHYALGSLARLVVQLTLNIVFVVGFDTGVVGILWSTLITHLTLGVGLAIWMLRRTGWAAPKALRSELFRFGLPYRVTAAGAFVLTYGDRFFLEDAHGLGEVGVYSLAYQFGFLLMSLGPGPFHLAWDPQRFQLAQRPKEEREPLYQSGFFFFSVLVLTLAVGIALFVRPLRTVMSAPEFHRAADLVPFVMAAFVCQSFGEVMDFGIQVSGKTIWTSVATWVAVVVTLVAYALLVPPYAGLGAALATFAGFTVRWILYRRFAQRLFPIDYKVSRAFGLIVLAAAVVGSAFALRPHGFFPEVAVATAGSLVFIGLTIAVVMRHDERRVLLAYVSKRLKRKS